MAWSKRERRPHVVMTRITDRDLQRMNNVSEGRKVADILQEALKQWLSSRDVEVPVVCSWCGTRIGTTYFTRVQLAEMPESLRRTPVSHGCCEGCRDAALAADAA
jgi:hypothetical protein